MKDNRYRSITKAVSWRVTGSIDTFIISYIITGKPGKALAISGIEVFTKIFLYYFHERLWNRLSFGRKLTTTEQIAVSSGVEEPNKTYYLPSILEFLFRRWRKNN